MFDYIDLDFLISLVQNRPILWDKTLEKYKDRTKTMKAWAEVFVELDHEYKQFDDKKKNEFGKQIIKKWRNVRDSYRKSRAKYKEFQKSGAGAKSYKTYIYDSQLQFLEKIFHGRETVETLLQEDFDVAIIDEIDRQSQENAQALLKNVFKTPRPPTKKSKDPFETEILNVLREKPNRHQSFFNGILPSIEDFNEFEVLEFQMDVLKSIRSIRERNQLLTKVAAEGVNKCITKVSPTVAPPITTTSFYETENEFIVEHNYSRCGSSASSESRDSVEESCDFSR